MTKEEAIKKHCEMWLDIAKKTRSAGIGVSKDYYFISHGITELPMNNCWMCEYTRQLSPSGVYLDCNLCPIDWGSKSRSGKANCLSWKSPFKTWHNLMMRGEGTRVSMYFELAELAEMIANLPVRR